ncbi:MAG: tetratricopeptide repeat protein [Candidatus Hydrogenedentota bacterium]|nr:MAG: tetratricopeptide repeat protein [Candidatus Hydrogenedentota bacterium]
MTNSVETRGILTTTDKRKPNSKLLLWADVFSVALLCFVTFANSARNPFIWDDKPLILQNESVRSLRYFPTQFQREFFFTGIYEGENSGGYYRPLVLVSFMSDYRLWRYRTPGYHLTNMIIHGLICFLIYWFIRLFYSRGAALVAALVFAAHPIHVNAVTYISGRDNMLAALFSIASVISYSHFALGNGRKRFAILVGSAVLFFLGLLSKEFSVVVVLLIASVDFFLIYSGSFRQWIRCIPRYLFHVTVFLLYLALRWQVVGLPTSPFRAFAVALPNRFEAATRALASLLGLFVMPVGQHFERFVRVPATLGEPAYVGSVLLFAALLALTVGAVRLSPKTAFLMLWFWIAFLPTSNFIPIYSSISKTAIFTGEQFMYLPSVGLCGLVGLIAAAAVGPSRGTAIPLKRPAQAAIGLALAALSLLTIRYNTDWRDPIEFYKKIIGYTPLNYRAHHNLGTELLERELYEEAEKEFGRVLEIYPSSINALHNLALLYTKQGEIERAIETYSDLLDRYPKDAEAHFLLGVIFLKRGSWENALTHLRDAVRLDESFADAHSALGALLGALSRPHEARTHLEKAISLKPGLVAARINLGNAYEAMGLYRLAAQQYSSALQLRPELEFLKESLERTLRASRQK